MVKETKISTEQERAPKRRSDWVGKWVRLRTELRNGVTVVPAGMLCHVEYGHRLAQLTTQPCKCCGVAVRISRVEWHHLEYIGTNAPLQETQTTPL